MNDLLKQLQALIPLAENATAEPWHQHGQEEVRSWADQSIISAPAGEHQLGTSPEDAAFIVAARNVLTPENLTALCAALAPQWVAVSERLPETREIQPYSWLTTHESECVLAIEAGEIKPAMYYCNEKGQWRQLGLEFHGHYAQVTHWMPLPTPPATMEGSPAHE